MLVFSFCKSLFNDVVILCFQFLKRSLPSPQHNPPPQRREQYRKTHRGKRVKHTDVLRKLLFRDICLCARLEKVKLLSTSSPKWGRVGPERKWAVRKPTIRTLRAEKHSFLDEVPHLWATSLPKCFAFSNVCSSDKEDSSWGSSVSRATQLFAVLAYLWSKRDGAQSPMEKSEWEARCPTPPFLFQLQMKMLIMYKRIHVEAKIINTFSCSIVLLLFIKLYSV